VRILEKVADGYGVVNVVATCFVEIATEAEIGN